MKIVFTVVFKKGYGGGVGKVAYEIAEYFAAHHDVVLVCSGENFGLADGENGLKLFTFPSAGRGHTSIPELNQSNVRQFYEFLNEFKPDIIHAHEPTSISLVSQVWAIQNNVPFIYTAHVLLDRILDFGAKDMLGIFKFKLTENFLNDYFSTFLHNCDAIIALNKPVEESVYKIGFQKRVFRIPNGRSLSLYNRCQCANISADPKILTFIGSLGPRKNQIFLLEMLSYLPKNYILQLVGSALVPHDEKELQTYSHDHHLDDRVIFTGEMAHKKIPPLLEKTHLFVSASKMEVQSLVILESLAAGCPVVGISNETIDEVIDDKVGACLPKNITPAEFAQHVMRICQLSPEAYQEMCENARQRVAHLDWSNVMKTTIEAYDEMIQMASSREPQTDTRLTKILNLIPSRRVREMFTQKFTPTSQRQLTSRTWLYSTLTILLSAASYIAVTLFHSSKKKSGD